MTKIKLCGLSRSCDIEAVNELLPEYIGFVFCKNSKRYITPDTASGLRMMLDPRITPVGVFVNEAPDIVAGLLNKGIIDAAQLHGDEDEEYIASLRKLTDRKIIKAFRVSSKTDTEIAVRSTADHILLDSGAGSGSAFDWSILFDVDRPYFLAGGLYPENVNEAVSLLHPYAVDVSSGIETDGSKDKEKMAAFTAAVRKDN